MLRLYGLHTEAKRCTGRNPGATRILLIARSVACSFLVEADHARDMVQHLGRNRLAIQNACHDRIRHGCVELVRVVTNVELPRGTLVEPMDELVQDHGGGRAEPPAAAAQRVPAAEGGVDQINELVIVQELVDGPEFVRPELVSIGQQHLEETALRIRATDHGASMALERVRCTIGRKASIARYDDEAPAQRSRKISVSVTDVATRPAKIAGLLRQFRTRK